MMRRSVESGSCANGDRSTLDNARGTLRLYPYERSLVNGGGARMAAPREGQSGAAPRDPFAPVRWDLVPGRTALVLIDLQRDFLHPEGWYASSGVDISHMRRVIEPTHELV